MTELVRCSWAGSAPEYIAYHDDEWGRPLHGDTPLFERLSLEAFQSGLSWLIILRKRPAFRSAFAGFDPAAVAAFGADDVARLLADAGIVRNRAKIEAAIHNAGRVLALDRSLDELLWSFAPATHARPATLADVPGDLAGVDGHGQGAEAPRVPLRRADHLLRADAGRRTRRRPRGGLLASRRSVTALVALGESLVRGGGVDRSGFPPVRAMGENEWRIRPRALPGAPAHRRSMVGTTNDGSSRWRR